MIWLEKASKVSDEFDFNADGGSFQRSQKQLMMLKQASYMQSRSKSLSKNMSIHPKTVESLEYTDLPYKDEIEDYENNLS